MIPEQVGSRSSPLSARPLVSLSFSSLPYIYIYTIISLTCAGVQDLGHSQVNFGVLATGISIKSKPFFLIVINSFAKALSLAFPLAGTTSACAKVCNFRHTPITADYKKAQSCYRQVFGERELMRKRLSLHTTLFFDSIVRFYSYTRHMLLHMGSHIHP